VSDETKGKDEGWSWPMNSRKAHYFRMGMALCGKMLYLGSILDQGNNKSPDNCAECRRKRIKELTP